MRRNGPPLAVRASALHGLGMLDLLWVVAVLFALMWVFGFALHIGGSLIHLLIVLAVIAVLVRLLTGRTPV